MRSIAIGEIYTIGCFAQELCVMKFAQNSLKLLTFKE